MVSGPLMAELRLAVDDPEGLELMPQSFLSAGPTICPCSLLRSRSHTQAESGVS